MATLTVLGLLALSASPAQTAAAVGVIAQIQVHGNHVTADDEIIRLSGVAVGDSFDDRTIETVRTRLRQAKLFDDVVVSKRYASIEDPSKIAIVIVVNEGPVRVEVPDDPGAPLRVIKRGRLTNFMLMPLLDAEDGYGVTYGVRVAYVGVTGERGRVSFPLTWGGFKRAGAEFDRTFTGGPLTRVQVGTAVEESHNPAFDLDDTRGRVWMRAERGFGPVRAGGTASWQHVSFADSEDDVRSAGVDVTFDTRADPVLPRNAVYALGSWTTLSVDSGTRIARTRLEGRGYLGLIRQSVLVVRAQREDADRPLPPYLKSLLGGWSNLRGFKAGSRAGDTVVSGSMELRVPLSSPLSVARLGVSVFVDTGTAYDNPQRFADQSLDTGVGGSVWLTATMFRVGVSVAHGLGASTRVNFGAGLSF